MDDLQPQMQRQMGRLENGPHPHREGLAAGVALGEAGAGDILSRLDQNSNTGVHDLRKLAQCIEAPIAIIGALSARNGTSRYLAWANLMTFKFKSFRSTATE
jgi:hypothetical protein